MTPEKREFLELFEASGWSQADLARELDMTRGGIHGLVKGDTNPSIATVRLLRFVLAQKNPQAITNVKYSTDQSDIAMKDEPAGSDLDALIASIKAQPRNRQPELIDTLKRVVKLSSKT